MRERGDYNMENITTIIDMVKNIGKNKLLYLILLISFQLFLGNQQIRILLNSKIYNTENTYIEISIISKYVALVIFFTIVLTIFLKLSYYLLADIYFDISDRKKFNDQDFKYPDWIVHCWYMGEYTESLIIKELLILFSIISVLSIHTSILSELEKSLEIAVTFHMNFWIFASLPAIIKVIYDKVAQFIITD